MQEETEKRNMRAERFGIEAPEAPAAAAAPAEEMDIGMCVNRSFPVVRLRPPPRFALFCFAWFTQN